MWDDGDVCPCVCGWTCSRVVFVFVVVWCRGCDASVCEGSHRHLATLEERVQAEEYYKIVNDFYEQLK